LIGSIAPSKSTNSSIRQFVNLDEIMIRIAVDAMGGDHAPLAIVDGAVAAARHLDVQISLTGRPGAIEEAVDRHPDWRDLGVATTIPTRVRIAPTVLLDAGANVECRPQHLLQFAAMAYRFARSDFLHRVEHEIAGATVDFH